MGKLMVVKKRKEGRGKKGLCEWREENTRDGGFLLH